MSNMQRKSDWDEWAEWLFDRRFGRSDLLAQEGMGVLFKLREQVIDAVQPKDGDRVLDLGSGDGFIAFKALTEVEPNGHVIFTDISAPLLAACKKKATELGKVGLCSFVQTSAETLEGIADASVDIVTSRSTIVYVEDKKRVLRNAVRVLKPKGRLSLLEPIARYGWVERSNQYLTWDLAPLGELGRRLDEYFKARDTSIGPRYALSERDLVRWAEELGLEDIHMRFTINITVTPKMAWETALQWSPNPCAPTLEQALTAPFSDSERKQVVECLKPQVEAGTAPMRQAIAHLVATKPDTPKRE